MHLDIGIDVEFLLEDRGNARDRLIGRVAGFPVESGDDRLVDLVRGLGANNRRGGEGAEEVARDPQAVASDIAPRRPASEYVLHVSPPQVSERFFAPICPDILFDPAFVPVKRGCQRLSILASRLVRTYLASYFSFDSCGDQACRRCTGAAPAPTIGSIRRSSMPTAMPCSTRSRPAGLPSPPAPSHTRCSASPLGP